MIDLRTAPTTPFLPPAPAADWSAWEGEYTGTSRVIFAPGSPGQEAACEAVVTVELGGRYLRIRTAGTAGETPNAGEHVFSCADDGTATMVWLDSFHSERAPMTCTGRAVPGEIDVLGHYSAGGETWGWRTRIAWSGGALAIEAWNVLPGGEEFPALRVALERR